MLDRWNDTLEGLLCRVKEFELCLDLMRTHQKLFSWIIKYKISVAEVWRVDC